MRIRELSSAEIDRHFPYVTRVIQRTLWETSEHLVVNTVLHRLGGSYRCGWFNGILRYHLSKADHAETLSEFMLDHRLDRLRPNCRHGSSREEVAAEWRRIDAERDTILAWGRQKGRLQDVVQEYRFARRQRDLSNKAIGYATEAVARADPTVADPANHAGVLLEWAEKEHRDWFWRCCRDRHLL